MSIGTLRSLESQVGALLERHESGRDLSEFTRYADDPVAFIREVLKRLSLNGLLNRGGRI